MKIKKIISIVLAMMTMVTMSISAFAVNREYAVEVPANEVIEDQFPVEFISDSSNGRVRRGVSSKGYYELARGNWKDSCSQKFKMNKFFGPDHNAFSIVVKPEYETCNVQITSDDGYESKVFSVSKKKTITVKNAKSDVKYTVTFSLDDDCIEAKGSYTITSFCSK